jgi:branched-chain amino acid transport system substrate-binding protein
MKNNIKSIITVLAFATSVSAFAADTIKIGVSGPYTGGSSPMGVSMRDGVRLAAAEINAKGGVLGRKIELIERDDEAKNERGVQVTQELINKEHVVAAMGFINTGVSLAAQRFYQEAKIPVLNNVATGSIVTKQFLPPEHPDNYVFRTSAADVIQSALIVKQAVDVLKFTKVAILADSTNYGQLGREDLEKALAAKNMKPVAVEKFNVKDVDMTAQLLKAKEAGAQAVLTYAIGPELAQIANGMEKLGWKVPMIGSWTLSMGNFIDNAGKNGEGALMPETFIQEPNTPKRKAFIAAYQKAYNPANGRIPSPVSAAQGYDSMYILAAAIKQAGNTDGVKIRETLENLNEKIEGVVTTYDHPYTHDDHEAITINMVVMGKVQDGHVVYANESDKGTVVREKAKAKK